MKEKSAEGNDDTIATLLRGSGLEALCYIRDTDSRTLYTLKTIPLRPQTSPGVWESTAAVWSGREKTGGLIAALSVPWSVSRGAWLEVHTQTPVETESSPETWEPPSYPPGKRRGNAGPLSSPPSPKELKTTLCDIHTAASSKSERGGVPSRARLTRSLP